MHGEKIKKNLQNNVTLQADFTSNWQSSQN